MSERNLLNDIAERVNISYLSDLHIVPRAHLVSQLKELVNMEYSPEDWSYALSYMSGKKVVCGTIDDVNNFLSRCEMDHKLSKGL